MAETCYIVTIEGVGLNDGGATPTQVKYCTLIPDYAVADDEYIQALKQEPSGVASKWDVLNQTITVGDFTLTFKPGVANDPISWLKKLEPVCELREPINNTKNTDIKISGTVADTDTDGYCLVYIDRETIQVANTTEPATDWDGVVRGVCGSRAESHGTSDGEEDASTDFYAGSDVYDEPPVLTGRLVKVYSVAKDAAASSSETLILYGYVEAEPAAGFNWVSLQCVSMYSKHVGLKQNYCAEAIINGDGSPSAVYITTDENQTGTYEWPFFPPGKDETTGNTGGYWWIPEWNVVLEGDFTDVGDFGSGWGYLTVEPVVAGDWNPPALSTAVDGGKAAAYPILFGDTNFDYSAFGKDDGGGFEVDANPVVAILNMILSLDETNSDGSDVYTYDLGAHIDESTNFLQAGGLYPSFSLAVDRDNVDLDAFESAREELEGIVADRLFVGGDRLEDVLKLFARLVSPYGYTVGSTRTGWSIFRLADTYGTAGVTALTTENLVRPSQWAHQILGRPMDSVVIKTDPLPGQEGTTPIKVREVTRRRFYPQHIGRIEEWPSAPYTSGQFAPDTWPRHFIENRLRRLTSRVVFLTVVVGELAYDEMDVGDVVSMTSPHLWNPVTGNHWKAGDDAIVGMVVSSDIDWRHKRNKITVVWVEAVKTARWSPCAKVAGGGFVVTYSVEQHEFTRTSDDEDADKFDVGGAGVGDEVVLLDSHLALRSDPDQGVRITSNTATQVVISAQFRDVHGALLTGNDNDNIAYAKYDDVNASQTTATAFLASGGAPSTGIPYVGDADVAPYVWGD